MTLAPRSASDGGAADANFEAADTLRTASAAAPRPGNNFDALRLLGALLVAASHAFHFLAGAEPLGAATGNQTFGGLGLNLFCVISGYLITRSRQRRAPREFARARFLRIFPGLAVATLVLAFVVGPLATEHSLGQYLRARMLYRFLASALVFPLNQTLPGVFEGASLNGPLYSLTAEVMFYAFVGVFGGRRLYPLVAGAAFVVVATCFVRHDYVTMPFSTILSAEVGRVTLFYFPARLGGLCVYYLLAGSLLALVAFESHPLRRAWPLWLVLWLAAFGAADRRVYDAVEMAVFPMLVLAIGSERGWVIRLDKRLGDISYGTYVYHSVVIQVVLHAGPSIGLGAHPHAMVAIATMVSCACGWLSYHFVERRFIDAARA